MTDREALAAALEFLPAERSIVEAGLVEDAAERYLAQLPEKCEHGESVEHWRLENDRDDWLCPGKVYPAGLVERLERVIAFADDMSPEQIAVAVLEALNGEAP